MSLQRSSALFVAYQSSGVRKLELLTALQCPFKSHQRSEVLVNETVQGALNCHFHNRQSYSYIDDHEDGYVMTLTTMQMRMMIIMSIIVIIINIIIMIWIIITDFHHYYLAGPIVARDLNEKISRCISLSSPSARLLPPKSIFLSGVFLL